MRYAPWPSWPGCLTDRACWDENWRSMPVFPPTTFPRSSGRWETPGSLTLPAATVAGTDCGGALPKSTFSRLRNFSTGIGRACPVFWMAEKIAIRTAPARPTRLGTTSGPPISISCTLRRWRTYLIRGGRMLSTRSSKAPFLALKQIRGPFYIVTGLLLAAGGVSGREAADFFRQNCVSCHTIGGGRLTGPDLKNITQRKEREWLIEFLQSPQAMMDKGDPYA